jgi:signal transduction histidine kinase/transcriptional regulator with XRE-family HTH domain
VLDDDSLNLDGLGQIIRQRRAALNLTQVQLAERLGWTQERISVLERGKYGMPSLQSLIRLAGSLELGVGDLIRAAGYTGPFDSLTADSDHATAIALHFALQRLLTIEASSLEEVLNEASDFMAQVMGADKIDAMVYEAENDSLVAVGTSKTPMGERQHQLGLHREPLANGGRSVEVYRTGVSYYTPQADRDPGMLPGLVGALRMRSYLAVPLKPDGEIIGVLSAASEQPDRFGTDERHFFEAAARWIAQVARRAELVGAVTSTAVTEARRMAAEELITLLAHDLGNALTPALGRLHLLRRRISRGEEQGRLVDDVDEIERSIQRTRRMVSELLDVTRLDRGLFMLSLDEIDAVSLVDEISTEFRALRSGITLYLPEELRVIADAGRVTQVLRNLLTNAVKHVPDNAAIVVTAGLEHRDGMEYAVIDVHDEGPGIPDAVKETLFTRFVTSSNAAGLGLGLYLSRKIAEEHGGMLTLDSGPGIGTTFRLWLPVEGPCTDDV